MSKKQHFPAPPEGCKPPPPPSPPAPRGRVVRIDDVIARWHLIAHAPPARSSAYDLLAVGGELAAEVGALRERNTLLEQAAQQHVVAFIERLAAQDCAFLQTRRVECGDGDYRCIPCDARVVYELMRAGM